MVIFKEIKVIYDRFLLNDLFYSIVFLFDLLSYVVDWLVEYFVGEFFFIYFILIF